MKIECDKNSLESETTEAKKVSTTKKFKVQLIFIQSHHVLESEQLGHLNL